jgi:hypothetical protein
VYLAFEQNSQLYPIAWAKDDGPTCCFPSIGRNIIYSPVYYADNRQTPAGDAFLLDKDGNMIILTPDNRDSLLALGNYGWTIPAKSGDNSWFGGPVEGIIDGNYDNAKFWHVGANEDFPHWAVIDMKTPRTVTRIVTLRHIASFDLGGDTKSVEYYISDNVEGPWTLLVAGAYKSNNGSSSDPNVHYLTLNAPTPLTGRYLKLSLPDSFRATYASIVEVDVYELK